MVLTGMGLSTIGAAVGAMMGWAVTYQVNDVRLSTDGVLLVIAGKAGFPVSSIVFGVSRKSMDPGRHTIGRRVLDLLGHASSVHEETVRRETSNRVHVDSGKASRVVTFRLFISGGTAMKHHSKGSTHVCSFRHGDRCSRGRYPVSHFPVTAKGNGDRFEVAERSRAWTPIPRVASAHRETNRNIRGVITSLEQKEEDQQ
ncbi:MAG TPA: hypothetical protein VND89_08300 [Acidimicrobiales bacterium]|nr:hypothetical protein [Acidimicrobiales bacterium]